MGRILVIEFNEKDAPVYDEIMRALKRHPAFGRLRISNDSMSNAALEVPGLEICLERRRVFRNQREIKLTTKEYDLLCLLAANQGIVLTYKQIYQKVWDEEGLGTENDVVGCHICRLRKKLCGTPPDSLFTIRCIREVGYCLEVDESKTPSEYSHRIAAV